MKAEMVTCVTGVVLGPEQRGVLEKEGCYLRLALMLGGWSMDETGRRARSVEDISASVCRELSTADLWVRRNGGGWANGREDRLWNWVCWRVGRVKKKEKTYKDNLLDAIEEMLKDVCDKDLEWSMVEKCKLWTFGANRRWFPRGGQLPIWGKDWWTGDGGCTNAVRTWINYK